MAFSVQICLPAATPCLLSRCPVPRPPVTCHLLSFCVLLLLVRPVLMDIFCSHFWPWIFVTQSVSQVLMRLGLGFK